MSEGADSHFWKTIKEGHNGFGSFKVERCVKCDAVWTGAPSQYPEPNALPLCLPWARPWKPG